ncbi:thioesterase II family protein [Streptomyces sp. NPDC059063]|uniref:thioesterase II family protein n=1 Tax=unclassified Streptomyces TaxID=2593676 RepID=UPI003687B766
MREAAAARRARLVCLPHAGGAAGIYRSWSAALAPDIEVVPVELAGRDGRVREPPLWDMDALVADVAQRLAGLDDGQDPVPYALFGHSLGAIVAYETAREMQRRGRAPAIVIASGSEPPHRVAENSRDRHLLPDDAFLREVLRLGGTSADVLREPELLRVVLPRLRADYSVAETYVHRRGALLTCPLAVYVGDADPTVRHDLLTDWAQVSSGHGQPVASRRFPGGHFYLDDARADVLPTIGKDLDTALRVRREAP